MSNNRNASNEETWTWSISPRLIQHVYALAEDKK